MKIRHPCRQWYLVRGLFSCIIQSEESIFPDIILHKQNAFEPSDERNFLAEKGEVLFHFIPFVHRTAYSHIAYHIPLFVCLVNVDIHILPRKVLDSWQVVSALATIVVVFTICHHFQNLFSVMTVGRMETADEMWIVKFV